jgi:allophanate hydrolase subunit 1
LIVETIMGNSLHNKIHLGRRIDLHSRTAHAVMWLGAAAGLALVWLAIQTLK